MNSYSSPPQLSRLGPKLQNQKRNPSETLTQGRTRVSSTYSDLGRLIEKHQPYGRKAVLPDLGNSNIFRSNDLKPAPSDDVHVDVFGPLRAYGEGNRLPVEITATPGGPEVMPVGDNPANPVEKGAFRVTLNSGEEFRITKGLRIPYEYKDEKGNTVYASIIVLYNGTGHP
jgi:hypothetical protein